MQSGERLAGARALSIVLLAATACSRTTVTPSGAAEDVVVAVAQGDRQLSSLVAARPGAWRAVGQELESSPLDPREVAPPRTRLPAKADGAVEVRAFGGGAVRLKPRGALSVAAREASGRVVYAGAYRDTDAVWVTAPGRVELLLVLRSATAPHELVLEVERPAELPTVRRDSDGGVRFVDGTGRERLRVPPAFAVDARGVRREAALTYQRGEAGADQLAVRLDARGLTYPVLLDPALESVVWDLLADVAPLARAPAGAAWDGGAGRMVIFGGEIPDFAYLDDTWEFDGDAWTARAPAGKPPARCCSALAYDVGRGVSVLFGGYGYDQQGQDIILGDTWEWDRLTWQLAQPAHAPEARVAFTLVHDAARAATVLYGGIRFDGTVFDDTWLWDGVDWTPSRATAPGRYAAAAAYDAARKVTVLHGGLDMKGAYLADTLEWDGAAWKDVTPQNGVSPGPRAFAAMTFDPRGKQVVLHGGYNDTDKTLADTWSWDGARWTRGADGPHLSGHALTFDDRPGRGAAVAFGGGDDQRPYRADTWAYDGAAWRHRFTRGPGVAVERGLAWDADRQVAVLFGGFDANAALLDETWEWDGVAWSQRHPAHAPPARYGVAMVYDGARKRTLLFGGFDLHDNRLGDTWEWDGSDWTPRAPAHSPSPRNDPAATYDEKRHQVVLVGGNEGGLFPEETWLWDGADWSTAMAQGAPPGREYGRLVWDSRRGVAVLFGGRGPLAMDGLDDTWEWDGAAWKQAHPAHVPDPRYRHGAAYDRARGVTVVYGGLFQKMLVGDKSWDWDGADWRSWTPAAPPVSRADPAMVFDGRRVMLVGGVGITFFADVWSLTTHGAACIDGSTCDSGFCVDGVCCDQAACGSCQACDIAAGPGRCLPVLGGDDPDSCTGMRTCSAAGVCGLVQAQACKGDGECASGYCTDGVCCEARCDGTCKRCDQKVGTCTVTVGKDLDGDCAHDGTKCDGVCDASGKGTCVYPGPETACGLCKVCSAGACGTLPRSADDPGCGTVSCGGLDDVCRKHSDRTAQRCVAVGLCAAPNDPTTCTEGVSAPEGTACPGGACQAGRCVQGAEPVATSAGCGCHLGAAPARSPGGGPLSLLLLVVGLAVAGRPRAGRRLPPGPARAAGAVSPPGRAS